ncbi:hypothetical protein [Haloprofundus sp. MHR1]|uniref:DUF7096 domain-containing protein n=1 Tax=Haloprofundus sp. MHR1 TaxID=2572921 RepID=UPI0010BE9366|nr:hypothetical protein [Haloprofundus sp. MHR1]QCJ47067.1 hypothetical protein FCF25_08050 [Haloprofundus sp. MHR1]
MMRQSAALATTLLLLVSSVGGVVVATPSAAESSSLAAKSESSLAEIDNETSVLMLDEDDTNTAFGAPSANLSASLAVRDTRVRSELRTRTTGQRLAAMENENERRKAVLRALTELEIRVDDLRAEERAALDAHTTGEITATQLLVRLAHVHTEAAELRANATMLERTADGIDGLSIDGRVGSVRLELQTMRGPIRERAAAVLRGGAPPTRTYVQTTTDGVVLSMIDDGVYVREVYDDSKRTSDASGRITVGELPDVMERAYPVIMQRGEFNSPTGVQASNIFVGKVRYAGGDLTAYVDRGDEGQVFREIQRIPLDNAHVAQSTNSTRSGLELRVHPTYAGGPLRIELVDAATGDSVQGNVSLGSPDSNEQPTFLGRTDADGVLWTPAPDGEFVVQAIRGNSFVSIELTPDDPMNVSDPNDSLAPPPTHARVGADA